MPVFQGSAAVVTIVIPYGSDVVVDRPRLLSAVSARRFSIWMRACACSSTDSTATPSEKRGRCFTKLIMHSARSMCAACTWLSKRLARSRGETAADGGEGGAIRSPPGTVRGVALPKKIPRASIGVVATAIKTRTEYLINTGITGTFRIGFVMVKIRQNVVRVKCLRFIVLLRKLIIYKFNETTLFDVQNTIHFGTPRHPLVLFKGLGAGNPPGSACTVHPQPSMTFIALGICPLGLLLGIAAAMSPPRQLLHRNARSAG